MSIIELFAGRSGLESNGAVELTRSQHGISRGARIARRSRTSAPWMEPCGHRLCRSELFQAPGLRSGRVPVSTKTRARACQTRWPAGIARGGNVFPNRFGSRVDSGWTGCPAIQSLSAKPMKEVE